MKMHIIAKGENLMRQTILAGLVSLAALPALAEEATTYPFEGSFEDATFAVESAIIDRGLGLVEAAGIEPASADSRPSGLHAYFVFDCRREVTRRKGKTCAYLRLLLTDQPEAGLSRESVRVDARDRKHRHLTGRTLAGFRPPVRSCRRSQLA